jgi:phage repressor protein C with HTH and peptisase S24 domain
MEPVIPSRQAVGIDTGVSKVTLDGDIYAIEHGGLLRVKRLYRMPGGKVRINSYNSEYPDETVPERDITVLGRIFWWSVLR